MKMTVGGRVFYLKRTGRHLKGRPGEPYGGHYTDRAHAALIKGDQRHKNTMSGHFGEFAVSIKGTQHAAEWSYRSESLY